MQASNRKKVLAISGSTRQASSNQYLLQAIAASTAAELDITFFNGLAALPQFNPDALDNPGEAVAAFRQQLQDAAGVIICTPEYAHGVPGALKNAIDWTVGTSDFSGKPTLLITASTEGRFGHAALLETLRVIEAKNIDQLQLLIPFVKTKVSSAPAIIDEKTLAEIKQVLEVFIDTLNEI